MISLAEKAGKNLKALIEARGLTQEKAATLIGVDERSLRRYLKNGIDRISTLEAIARQFNVDLVATFLK